MMQPLDGAGGMFTVEQVEAALPARKDRYTAHPSLVCVEQTTNYGGGRAWPLEQIEGGLAVARAQRVATHLDGARLMNAVVASGIDAAAYAGGFSTAWIDFTKGLGAPVGACLAGSAELIEEAWRFKQMMGGALRQAGIVAAAGLYALDHNVERLAEDHDNARALAVGLAELPGARIDASLVETNIVIFEVDDPPAVLAALAADGVEMTQMGPGRIRAVTHMDVDRAGVETALDALGRALRV